MVESEDRKLVMPSEHIKAQQEKYHRAPQFDKNSIAETAKEMFPGCEVHWSKTYLKENKMIILMSGKDDPKDIVPIVLEGKLPHIAKTLIIIYAAVQHVVVKNMAGRIKAQQSQEQKKIHTGSPNENSGEHRPQSESAKIVS